MPDTLVSELGPIDPKSLSNPSEDETEKAAPWIVRKLVGVRGIISITKCNIYLWPSQ